VPLQLAPTAKNAAQLPGQTVPMAQYPFAHSRSMMHELPFRTCPTKTWSHAAGEGGGAD
jgi:hypothetical protein